MAYGRRNILLKDPVKTGINKTRVWVTSQVVADKNSTAATTNDMLSPGIYHIKIFGDAADNASRVNLTMTLIKKLMVNRQVQSQHKHHRLSFRELRYRSKGAQRLNRLR